MSGSANPNAGFDRFLVWKEYENVAMHFNDLIIRLRSQSLGGVAAVATLATVVARNDTTAELRWGIVMGAFALLLFFWVAVWILDMTYYNRLLLGAVDALILIEKESQSSNSVDKILLSTKIEERVRSRQLTNNRSLHLFYLIVFMALLLTLILAICMFRRDAAAGSAHIASLR